MTPLAMPRPSHSHESQNAVRERHICKGLKGRTAFATMTAAWSARHANRRGGNCVRLNAGGGGKAFIARALVEGLG
jgi:hypothetical protein